METNYYKFLKINIMCPSRTLCFAIFVFFSSIIVSQYLGGEISHTYTLNCTDLCIRLFITLSIILRNVLRQQKSLTLKSIGHLQIVFNFEIINIAYCDSKNYAVLPYSENFFFIEVFANLILKRCFSNNTKCTYSIQCALNNIRR